MKSGSNSQNSVSLLNSCSLGHQGECLLAQVLEHLPYLPCGAAANAVLPRPTVNLRLNVLLHEFDDMGNLNASTYPERT
ncbi:Glucan endo-1 [Psidium guajava]|nr:Glucan endo-1 [Psidium guajava]